MPEEEHRSSDDASARPNIRSLPVAPEIRAEDVANIPSDIEMVEKEFDSLMIATRRLLEQMNEEAAEEAISFSSFSRALSDDLVQNGLQAAISAHDSQAPPDSSETRGELDGETK